MGDQQSANVLRHREAELLWEGRRKEIEASYLMGRKSQREMASLFGVTQTAFCRALKRLGITAKPKWRSGPESGRFKDGTQSTIYRKMVAKEKCSRCGATKDLVIHHRDGVHTNNVLSNLEVLCSPCHTSHHKREWWESMRNAS